MSVLLESRKDDLMQVTFLELESKKEDKEREQVERLQLQKEATGTRHQHIEVFRCYCSSTGLVRVSRSKLIAASLVHARVPTTSFFNGGLWSTTNQLCLRVVYI